MNNDELMPFNIATVDNTKDSIIKVIGVGGGGGNAVNNMFEEGIENVDFIICNTDKQVLDASPIPTKIQLGYALTEGLGAGNDPNQGREAAKESIQEIMKVLQNRTKMVFIAAGMGGGTGTGAAPIVAQVAKELKILTVGIVTIPFLFEGEKRVSQAIEGLNELKQHVDSMIVINNEKLIDVYGDLEITEAFGKADEIITVAAKGIAEIITKPGKVNVDFADVKSVMRDSGVAVMGTGYGEGDKRAIKAVKNAITSPLLNNNDIKGAKNLLVNIISPVGRKISAMEIKEINDYLQQEAGFKANLIWGMTIDEKMGDDNAAVTVVATQFNDNIIPSIDEILGKSVPEKKSETNEDGGENKKVDTKRKTELDIHKKFEAIESQKFDYTDESVVNEHEKVPAYKRQKLDIDFTLGHLKNTSRFRLNNGNGNNFLNPMVD